MVMAGASGPFGMRMASVQADDVRAGAVGAAGERGEVGQSGVVAYDDFR